MVFQSTPPHGERLAGIIFKLLDRCFNPRPRTGSDIGDPVLTWSRPLFQSTPPHGERQTTDDVETTTQTVSIHAPARGATP